jgi:negative regulator of flagellin synthesis FlgM
VPSKINDLTTGVTAGRTSAPSAPSRETSAGSGVAPATGSGEVHITDTATQLASLEQTLRDSPSVDSLRVESMRQAIEQGTYQVQPQHIATQLLQIEHALGGLTGPSAGASETPASPEGR